jgi:hypothetical protein
MLRRVALVRTNVSEERIASIIRVTRIVELGMLAVSSNRNTLQSNAITINTTSICSQRASVDSANVPGSPILVTMMMAAIRSS